MAYAIFQNTEYLDAIGMQQLLWKYLEDIGHPAMNSLLLNFTNHVGEDIELCNASLGHAVRSKKGQSDIEHLSHSYRRLGVMFKRKTALSEQVLNVRSLKGWTENKHLRYKSGDATISETVVWIRELIVHFKEGTFKHYKIPKNVRLWISQQSVLGKRKKCKSFQSTPSGSRQKERSQMQLLSIPYVLDFNWPDGLKKSLQSVLTRPWPATNIKTTDVPSAETIRDFLFT